MRSAFYRFVRICIIIACGLIISYQTDAGILEGAKGNVSTLFSKSSGNTDKGSMGLNAKIMNVFNSSEILIQGEVLYAESDNKMDRQKWETSIKYVRNSAVRKKWFRSYQILFDHDRFSDVDYRVIPSFGAGYHVSKKKEWICNVDMSFGYEVTNFRSKVESESQVVFIIEGFVQKEILDNASISKGLRIIPGLEDMEDIRVRSEIKFTNPLKDNINLEIKYVMDYDSRPSVGKTSVDKQLMMGIQYKF